MKSDMTADKSEPKPSFGGGSSDASKNKAEPKESTVPGMPPKESIAKGDNHDKPKDDPKDPNSGDKREPGEIKPDKQLAKSDAKKPSSDPGAPGDMPPPNAGETKPGETPIPPARSLSPKSKMSRTRVVHGARPRILTMPAATSDRTQRAQWISKPAATPSPDQGMPAIKARTTIKETWIAKWVNSIAKSIRPSRRSTNERNPMSNVSCGNRKTAQQVRKKLDDLEKRADRENDRLKKKKVNDMRAAAEQAAKNYDNERPTPENLEKTGQNLGSKDERVRKDAERRIQDWDKDAQARKEMKKNVDELEEEES